MQYNNCCFQGSQQATSLEGRRVDITDEVETAQFFDDVLALHGSLDVLVNPVGGYAGGVKF